MFQKKHNFREKISSATPGAKENAAAIREPFWKRSNPKKPKKITADNIKEHKRLLLKKRRNIKITIDSNKIIPTAAKYPFLLIVSSMVSLGRVFKSLSQNVGGVLQ